MTHRLPRFAALIIVSLAIASGAFGQSVRGVDKVFFDDVYAGRDEERKVELYVRAVTRYGEPVADLRGEDFRINDASDRIASEDIEVRALSDTGLGMTCVIAIDVSRTMRGKPFDRTRSAALEFVRMLDPRDRVAVVAFADEVTTPVVFTDSRAEAEIQIQELSIAENALTTVLYDALHRSIDMIRLGSDLPRRSFVVVFSDGKDAGSRRTIEQVTGIGRDQRNQTPVPVYSIGYSRFGGDGLPNLRRISSETTGDYVRADTPEQIESFFRATRKQMRNSLVVSYPGDLDGSEHQIDLTLSGISKSRSAKYPKIRRNLLPYALAGGVALVVVGVAVFVGRGRSKGRLVFVTGKLAGQTFPRKSTHTKIGALEEMDIVISSELISRHHATITGSTRNAQIRDEQSSNGTYVNGNPISQSPLKPGDRIRMADVEAIFES